MSVLHERLVFGFDESDGPRPAQRVSAACFAIALRRVFDNLSRLACPPIAASCLTVIAGLSVSSVAISYSSLLLSRKHLPYLQEFMFDFLLACMHNTYRQAL